MTYFQIINNLAPGLFLELSANGPGWDPSKFTWVPYQGYGIVPASEDPSRTWSSWNIKDAAKNYYGNVTLYSDGKTVWYENNYKPGNDGHSLDGVKFSFDYSTKTYQLSTNTVTAQLGPFPNTPAAKPMTYPGSTQKVNLRVQGPNIVNDSGQIVRLKGVARPSLEWNPEGQMLSPEDIKNMAAWGSNCIRLSLNQNYWFTSADASKKGSYKQIIDAIIEEANKYGMAVILDLHWTALRDQSPMADKKSIEFWKQVAEKYKNFGTVMFELFNEPYVEDPQVWLNGNSTYAGYQQLCDAVRSQGANNICIVNGTDYGDNLSFVNDNFRVQDDNIVYGAHPYNEKTDTQRMEKNISGLVGKYPLIFTEFGVNTREKGLDCYDRVLEIADRLGINWTAWAWWKGSYEFPSLISDWNGKPVYGGEKVYANMKAKPPLPVYAEHQLHTRDMSVKTNNVYLDIKKQVNTLQKRIDSDDYFLKGIDWLVNLIPDTNPVLSTVKSVASFVVKRLLNVESKTENTEKKQALESLLTTTDTKEIQQIITDSLNLNHHGNLLKRVANFIVPDLFSTDSLKLAQKLLRRTPEKKDTASKDTTTQQQQPYTPPPPSSYRGHSYNPDQAAPVNYTPPSISQPQANFTTPPSYPYPAIPTSVVPNNSLNTNMYYSPVPYNFPVTGQYPAFSPYPAFVPFTPPVVNYGGFNPYQQSISYGQYSPYHCHSFPVPGAYPGMNNTTPYQSPVAYNHPATGQYMVTPTGIYYPPTSMGAYQMPTSAESYQLPVPSAPPAVTAPSPEPLQKVNGGSDLPQQSNNRLVFLNQGQGQTQQQSIFGQPMSQEVFDDLASRHHWR